LTEDQAQAGQLTPRELEVVRLFATGHRLSEVAEKLNRSPGTVGTHKFNAMQKLGVSNNAELIRYAYERGLI
jgi:two-component system capsular synthesis response regulator RcsB